VAVATVVLLLAAGSVELGSSSPGNPRAVLSASHLRSDPPPSWTAAPVVSHRGGPSACALTPDGLPDATIDIADRAFGPAVTVQPGDAVAFVNHDTTRHNVLEGTGGHADYDTACVHTHLDAGESTVVTFELPGDYPITCSIHASMQTVVHVRLR
jgi:plastocyanin